MNFAEIFSNLNYWAVFIAALSTFAVGGLWYSSILFGKRWMELNGFTKESLRENSRPMGTIMGTSFVASLLSAIVLAMFLGAESNVGFGVFAGLMIGIFWIGTARLNNVLYENQKFGLFFIHAGYDVVSYAIMGAIIGGWH
ncbi:MAG: DUF1761 domain-containing protein [Prolixibacteraceae bacterium]|jgi:hypothetical protein|nr:DUF1761 domain-containing protein [Prolixibacteraceae bacterium]